MKTSVLSQATQAVIHGSSSKPAPDQVVEALLQAERTYRKEKPTHSLSQFIGTWRLCFITGTRKTRQRAGVVLGAGRYLPSLFQITLSYSAPLTQPDTADTFEPGQTINRVQVGNLQIQLSGPAKLLTQKTIMAFDFTHLVLKLFGLHLIDRDIRGGSEASEHFYTEKIAQQAFFVYFWVEDTLIAARGRGGGLALWGRIDHSITRNT